MNSPWSRPTGKTNAFIRQWLPQQAVEAGPLNSGTLGARTRSITVGR